MSNAEIQRVAGPLSSWLLEESRFIVTTREFDLTLVERFRAAGLPIARFTTGVPSLHPQVDSFSTLWEEGKDLVIRTYRLNPENQASFDNSPIRMVYETGKTVHCPLEGPGENDRYEILNELRAAGLTDYVAVPLPFSDGTYKVVTFATKRPGGFTPVELEVFQALRHPLAQVFEIRYLHYLAQTLMDTYVGPVAGRRVLQGAIRRGSGETIRAAIWFCDLRGFTALSETLSAADLIELLNDYFGLMTAAVEAADGEVLKFIGDAVLAIFSPGPDEDDGQAAHRALSAAHAAVAMAKTRNEARAEAGNTEIGFGIGLHFGEVLYGNVGGETRLDFTVMGPAVNVASRLEGLTRDLGRSILLSEDFSRIHGGDFRSLGAFELKGVSQAQSIYVPLSD